MFHPTRTRVAFSVAVITVASAAAASVGWHTFKPVSACLLCESPDAGAAASSAAPAALRAANSGASYRGSSTATNGAGGVGAGPARQQRHWRQRSGRAGRLRAEGVAAMGRELERAPRRIVVDFRTERVDGRPVAPDEPVAPRLPGRRTYDRRHRNAHDEGSENSEGAEDALAGPRWLASSPRLGIGGRDAGGCHGCGCGRARRWRAGDRLLPRARHADAGSIRRAVWRQRLRSRRRWRSSSRGGAGSVSPTPEPGSSCCLAPACWAPRHASSPTLHLMARGGRSCSFCRDLCCSLLAAVLAGCGARRTSAEFIQRGDEQVAAGHLSAAAIEYRNAIKRNRRGPRRIASSPTPTPPTTSSSRRITRMPMRSNSISRTCTRASRRDGCCSAPGVSTRRWCGPSRRWSATSGTSTRRFWPAAR